MIDHRVQKNFYSGVITTDTIFENFTNLVLTDAGGDGFRVRDIDGNIAYIPTGIPVNMARLRETGRICRYLCVMSPVTGSLNVSFISDVPKGGLPPVSPVKLIYGPYYNWNAVTHFHQGANSTYGYLYNFYAARYNTGGAGIAPAGWHFPSYDEIITLIYYLDPTRIGLDPFPSVAGGMMKEAGTSHWKTPNNGATNSSGLTVLPSGNRTFNGTFGGLKEGGFILCASGNSPIVVELSYNSGVLNITSPDRHNGYPLLFIKDNSTPADCIDIDGNNYGNVVIGTQVWSQRNFKGTHYNNGIAIPNVSDNTAWGALTTGACCAYNNDESNVSQPIYDLLPAGWSVPTYTQVITLLTELGGDHQGGKLKEIGFDHWLSPNAGATNSSGFSARASGFRNGISGAFELMKENFMMWTQTEYPADLSLAIPLELFYISAETNPTMNGYVGLSKKTGCSVRGIKNDSTDPGTLVDINNNTYRTCKIGDQVWMAENLKVETFNNGVGIPVVDISDAAWLNLSGPAMCYSTIFL